MRRGRDLDAVAARPVRLPVLGLALGVGLTLGAFPHLAAGQTLRGRILAADEGSPVSAAFVSLLDDAGATADAGLTGPQGYFQLEADAAGTYRVRVERIGFEEWTSAPLELVTGETRSVRYNVRVRPVRLADLRIRVRGDERECVATPGEQVGVLEAWNEARKALEQTRWAAEQRLYRFSIREWEKRLGPRASRVEDSRSRTIDWLARTPYRSRSVETLAREGFVREEGDGSYVFYLPDARTLLSYRFIEAHCFGLRWREDEDRSFVGLAFEPVRSRRVPEIRGVLWIDEETAELDHIEFRYVNLPFRRAADEAGGRVELRRLPDGGFIVRRWWVRMPLFEENYLWIRGAHGDRTRHRLVGYEEDGAEVTAVYTADGRRLRMEEGGVVAGLVQDGARGHPAEGVRVALVGRSDSLSTVTDSAGVFRFEGVEPGEYRVQARDPRLELLGLPPAEGSLATRVRLGEREEETEIRLSAPSEEALFRRACPDLDPRQNVGVVAGRVRARETGEPIGGARVVARWSAGRPADEGPAGGTPETPETKPSLAATAGPDGSFRICGVPGGLEIGLEATAGGFGEVSVSYDQTTRIVEKHLFLEQSVDSNSEAHAPSVVGRCAPILFPR